MERKRGIYQYKLILAWHARTFSLRGKCPSQFLQSKNWQSVVLTNRRALRGAISWSERVTLNLFQGLCSKARNRPFLIRSLSVVEGNTIESKICLLSAKQRRLSRSTKAKFSSLPAKQTLLSKLTPTRASPRGQQIKRDLAHQIHRPLSHKW